MSVTKNNLLSSFALIALFCAIFIPNISFMGSLHASIIPLGITIFLFLAARKFKRKYLLILVCFVILNYLAIIILSMGYGFPVSMYAFRSFAPFFILFVSIFIYSNNVITYWRFEKALIIISAALSVFVIIQILTPTSSLMLPFIPQHRMDVLERYAMVMAPIGNPNNMGLVLALTIMSLQQLIMFRNNKNSAPKKQNCLCRIFGSNVFVLFIMLILFIGLLYTYARTVLAAFIVVQAYFIFIYCFKSGTKVLKTLIVLGLVIMFLFYQGFESSREFNYYSTVLSPLKDSSFVARFDYWSNSLIILMEKPLLILTGLSWYEGALEMIQGKTVIDSGYVFALLSHGLPFLIVILSVVVYSCYRFSLLIPIMVLLLVSSITLAYISDYRINIIIAFFVGYAVSLYRELYGSSCDACK